MSPTFQSLGLYIIFGVFLLIAGLIVWAVRAGKNKLAERKQLFLEFGFQEVPERASELTERMTTLHHHWTQRHSVEDPKRKSEWGYEMILFDLRDSSGDSTHTDFDQALLLSPDLKLPRFTLFPKMQGTGFLAGMANKAMAWVAAKFAVQAAFPDFPEFDAKYIVWGDDEAALRGYFSSSRLGRLAQTQELQLEGNVNGLLFSRAAHKRTGRITAEKLRILIEDGKNLFDIFKN